MMKGFRLVLAGSVLAFFGTALASEDPPAEHVKWMKDLGKNFGAIRTVPAAQTQNLRSDMYLAADSVRLLPSAGADFSEAEKADLKRYTGLLNDGTRYIPGWVKVCVAGSLPVATFTMMRSDGRLPPEVDDTPPAIHSPPAGRSATDAAPVVTQAT